ncbi:MAG: beta-propeller fold lactonase family protein [Acidobacteriota bacterium]|nr:beta-propeller fold lactonase family protein [Acidobacteriota bacterium]
MTYSLKATVNPGAAGTACGTTNCLQTTASAAVAAGIEDLVATNDSDQDSDTELTPQTDLVVAKTDNVEFAGPGNQLTYLISVNNAGPSSVEGARIFDDYDTAQLSTFDWSCTLGTELTLLEIEQDGSGGVAALAGVQGVALSPGGDALYTVAASDDGLQVFRRDGDPDSATFGELTVVEALTDGAADGGGTVVDGLNGAVAVTVAPGGTHVYVAGRDDDAVAVFAVQGDGTLRFLEAEIDGAGGVDGLAGASGVAVSPDGSLLFASGADDDAVAVFTIGSDGRLTFLEVQRDGDGGVSGLAGASAVAVSPDGETLYALGSDSDGIAVFSVQAGGLTFLEAETNGTNGVTNLNGPSALASSPDGDHLYVTAAVSDALVTFTVAADGMLSFMESDVDGVSGVDGLDAASGVAVAATGDRVYVTGPADGQVAVFERSATGAAIFLEGIGYQEDSEPRAVVASPEGRHLYSSSSATSSVAALSLGRRGSCETLMTGSTDPVTGSGDIDERVDLPAGSGLAYVAVARIRTGATGSVSNTAFVVAPAGTSDPNGGSTAPGNACPTDASDNNCSVDTTEIRQLADLQVTKTDGGEPAVPGESFSYQVTVSNQGPNNAAGVQVEDSFPSGFVCDTPTCWTCTTSGGGSCGSGAASGSGFSHSVTLAAGTSVTYDIEGTVLASATGIDCPDSVDPPPGTRRCLLNTVTATLPSGLGDPTLPNEAEVYTILEPSSDLQVEKAVVTVSPEIGAPLEYLIVVSNAGPSDAVGATVTDSFPSGFTCDAPTCWTCAASGGADCGTASGAGNLNQTVDLPVGGEVVYSVTGVVDASAPAVLTNTAQVNPPSGTVDPTPGNAIDTARAILAAEVDLAVTKSDNRSTAVPGETVTYSITVTNSATDDAAEVTVTDYFPAELRNVVWTCSSQAPASGLLTFAEAATDGLDSVDGLAGASAVAASPDGAHLYVAGAGEDSLAVFALNSATGELEFVETLSDGGTDGAGNALTFLAGPSRLVTSPDGSFVFVSTGDDAVLAFRRDTVAGSPNYGSLTLVETERDGQTDAESGLVVDGLVSPGALAMSPDGEHLYVLGDGGSAVSAFSWDPGSARLRFLETLAEGGMDADGTAIAGLSAAAGLALAPDSDGTGAATGGEHLYIAAAGSLVVFERIADSAEMDFGELRYLQRVQDGDVQAGAMVEGLTAALDVAVGPDGSSVYVAGSNAGDGAVAVFSRDRDSTSGAFGEVEFRAVSQDAELGSGSPSALAVSPDGQHLYASVSELDSLVVYQRNTATGELSVPKQDVVDNTPALDADGNPTGATIQGLAGVSDVVVAADGDRVFATGAEDNALAVFLREGAPPAFDFVSVVREGDVQPSGTVDGIDGATAVAVSTGGERLYATGFADGSLAVFERDPVSGEISFLEVHRDGVLGVDGLAGASAVVVSPDDLHVYVAGQTDNAVAVFEAVADGGLSFIQVLRNGVSGVEGLFGVSGLAVSPDGGHVYAASQFDAALAVFLRGTDGRLIFAQSLTNGVDGVAGLSGASSVAVSSDNVHVYVASAFDDTLTVFERDTASGDLELLQVLQDDDALTSISGALVTDGLDRAQSVAVSPDPGDGTGTAHVYVAAGLDGSVAVFLRDNDNSSSSYGQLTSVEVLKDGDEQGELTVDGLAGARSVVVSGDGKLVYATGEFDDALVVFARAESTGELTFVEARQDGVDGVTDLDQPFAAVVSPGGRHVYTVSLEDDAIALFSRASGSRCTGAGTGDIEDVVDLGGGSSITYTAVAEVDPAAYSTAPACPAGMGFPAGARCIENQATVAVPAGGAVDVDPSNDTDSDIDEIAPVADLGIEKTNDEITVVPGQELTYTLTVTNDGPSNVVGATVRDDLAAVFPDGATWTCLAVPSGSLRYLQTLEDGEDEVQGLDGAFAVAVSPDDSGEYVYVTGLAEDSLAIFIRDAVTGELAPLDLLQQGEVQGALIIDGLAGAGALTLSPDGEDLYVASVSQDKVAHFRRDDGTGLLTFVAAIQDGEAQGAVTIDGLDQPSSLAVSPDGEHLYVTGANDDAVAVFARDGVGALTFVEAQVGLEGLAGASAVVVSPDPDGAGAEAGGDHVYVAGANDGAVVVFQRAPELDGGGGANPDFGKLTFLERQQSATIPGLAEASALAISPDGLNLYVTGPGSGAGALVVFQRDGEATVGGVANGNFGRLSLVQTLVDGTGGVDGLAGARSLAVSPDGYHLYAAAGAEDALGVFGRDPELDGSLFFIETQREGLGRVQGLDGAQGVALAPDGRAVYATGRTDDSLVVFERPADTSCAPGGSGTLLEDSVSIAAGGRIVYQITGMVAADACPPPYPCSSTQLENTAEVIPPDSVEDPNQDDPATGDTVEGNNQSTDSDDLSARVDLSLTKADEFIEVRGLAGAADLVLVPDPDGDGSEVGGRQLYVAGGDSDAVAVFQRNITGGELTFVEALVDNQDGVEGLNGAAAVVLSPDGEHLYAAGAGDNAVAIFRRDSARLETTGEANPAFGRLTYLATASDDPSDGRLLGVSALAMSPDGKHLYAAATAGDAVSVWRRDDEEELADGEANPSFGSLTLVQVLTDGLDDVDGLAAVASLALSPDGEHLYAAGAGDDAVSIFARESNSLSADFGQLSFLDAVRDATGVALDGVASLALSPDGEHLYAAAEGSDSLSVWGRDAQSTSTDFGLLSAVETLTAGGADGGGATVDGLEGPEGLAVDDDFVYVAAGAGDALVVFSRESSSASADFGRLSFVEAVRDGQADSAGAVVGGLAGASTLVLSGTGGDLYATGAAADAVSRYQRQAGGELHFQEFQREGGGGVAPGQPVTYVIEVRNDGPSDVRGARLVDNFPGGLTDVTWECTLIQGLADKSFCGVLEGTGDIDISISLEAGGVLEVRATATVLPEATEDLVNTATVTAPDGVIELDGTDNSDTDDDTVLAPAADLSISKQLDPAAELVAGGEVTWIVTVENLAATGASDAYGAEVRDLFPEAVYDVSWTCEAEPVAGLLSPVERLDTGSGVTFEVERDGVNDPSDAGDAVDGLGGASAVTVSADGLWVFAGGGTEAGVAIFRRDIRNGLLSFVDAIENGDAILDDDGMTVGTVDGLAGVSALVESADGGEIYAAAAGDDALVVLERDSEGALSLLQVEQDGVGGINALGGAAALAVTGDGAHVYVAGEADDGIARFARDAGTGLVTFAGAVLEGATQGGETVSGLLGVASLALSSDEDFLYAAGDGAVAIFSRNAASGALTFVAAVADGDDYMDASGAVVGTVDGLAGARSLAVSAGGDHLHVAGDGTLVTFLRDGTTGLLSFVESLVDGDLAAARSLALSDDGGHLYIAAGDGISVFRRDADTGLPSFEQRLEDGDTVLDDVGAPLGTVDGLAAVAAVTVSPGGRHLYAAGTGDDALAAFSRQRGSLCTRAGTGAIFDTVDVILGGRVTYTATGTVSSGADGDLTNRATVTAPADTLDAIPGNNEATVTGTLEHRADLAVIKTDGLTEAVPGELLTYTLEVQNLGPSDISGAQVLDELPLFADSLKGAASAGFVAGGSAWSCQSSSVLGFVESWTDGEAQGPATVDGLAGVRWLVASPDGGHLYAAGADDDAVAVFSHGAGDQLFFQEIVSEGDAQGTRTVAGLAGASAAAFSPDGKHLYVTGATAGSVAVFERGSEGELGFLSSVTDGQVVAGVPVDGLAGAAAVAVSPDGAHVYVAGRDDDAVVALRRETDDGESSYGSLTLVQRLKDGFGQVPIGVLDGARWIALSPDGEHLYAAAQEADALAVFQRDADPASSSYGQLTLLQVLKDDAALTPVPGATVVDGLDFVVSLALSPGGFHLYAAALTDDSVTVFRRQEDPEQTDFGELTFLQLLRDGTGGVGGLDGAGAVAVSPDGSRVYATGVNDGALSVFRREVSAGAAGYGQLSLMGALRDGDETVTGVTTATVAGLDQVRFVGVGSGGGAGVADGRVYTASSGTSTLAVFRGQASSGCGAGTDGDVVSDVLDDSLDLAAGASAVYRFQGLVDPGSRGTLFNTAVVSIPAGGITDPGGAHAAGTCLDAADDADNDSCTDATEMVPASQLALTKEDGQTTAVAGLPLTYTLVVTNAGPSHAFAARVLDLLPVYDAGTQPAGFDAATASWTCVASAGSSCSAGPVPGDVADTVDLLAGGTLTYSVTATVHPSATGTLLNLAQVEPEPGAADPVPGDETDTDEDILVRVHDLAVTKSNGVDEVISGDPVVYAVEVANLGPSTAEDVRLLDIFPAQLLDLEWSCQTFGGVSCGDLPGNPVSIDQTFDLLPGEGRAYTVTATVDPIATGTLSNTATALVTPASADPEPGNNSQTDADPIVAPDGQIFFDGFETGDLSRWSRTVGDLVGPFEFILTPGRTDAWRQQDGPKREQRYRARFVFDAGDTTLAPGAFHQIYAAQDELTGRTVFALELGAGTGGHRVRAVAWTGDGRRIESTWAPLAPGRHQLEADWWASPRVESSAGGLRLWIDGEVAADLTGVDNHRLRVDAVRFGAVDGVDAGTRGRHRYERLEGGSELHRKLRPSLEGLRQEPGPGVSFWNGGPLFQILQTLPALMLGQADAVLARVGGEEITVAELQDAAAATAAGSASAQEGSATAAEKQALLDHLIERKSLLAAARREGYDQDPEVQAAIERILIGRFLEDQLEQRMAAVEVSEEEIQARYQRDRDRYRRPDRRRVALIQIEVPARADEERRRALRRKAEEALEAARRQPPDTVGFGELATRTSDDGASKYIGGVVGWLIPGREYKWGPEVTEAAFALAEAGQVSELVEADGAFYVVKLVDLEEGRQLPLERYRAAVRRQLLEEKRDAVREDFYRQLREEAEVSVNAELLEGLELPAPPRAARRAVPGTPGTSGASGAESPDGESSGGGEGAP